MFSFLVGCRWSVIPLYFPQKKLRIHRNALFPTHFTFHTYNLQVPAVLGLEWISSRSLVSGGQVYDYRPALVLDIHQAAVPEVPGSIRSRKSRPPLSPFTPPTTASVAGGGIGQGNGSGSGLMVRSFALQCADAGFRDTSVSDEEESLSGSGTDEDEYYSGAEEEEEAAASGAHSNAPVVTDADQHNHAGPSSSGAGDGNKSIALREQWERLGVFQHLVTLSRVETIEQTRHWRLQDEQLDMAFQALNSAAAMAASTTEAPRQGLQDPREHLDI